MFVIHLKLPESWSERQAELLAERLREKELPKEVMVKIVKTKDD